MKILILRKTMLILLLIVLCGLFVQAQRKSAKNIAPRQTSARFTVGDSALKIPLDIDNNIIRIEVGINNSKPLLFIFDTGASASVINSKLAAKLKLKSVGEAHGTATGGKIKGTYTTGVTLGVQGAEVSNQILALIPFNTPPGFEFDGIIGCNFIEQFVVEIDYENKIMNLYNPLTYKYSGNGEVIPLLYEKGKTPAMNAKFILEGLSILPEALLEVDTGADGAFIINRPFVKKHRLEQVILNTIQSSRNGAGGGEEIVIGRAKAVRFGRFYIENPPVGLTQNTEGAGASKEYDGLIGGEIFRRFKVIFDYSRKQMILEPNKSFNDPYEIDNGN